MPESHVNNTAKTTVYQSTNDIGV